MSKRKMEDIKFNKKRVETFILPKVSQVIFNVEKEENLQAENINKRLKSTPQFKLKKRFLRKSIILFFIISIIFGLIYWSLKTFEMANILINSKHQFFTFNNKEFIASKELNSPIGFEIMIMSEKEIIDISLTESQNLSTKAKGRIILYNEYSTNTQKILTGTFLADNDGKSYKIDNTVTIPGFKKETSKIIPGQAEVNITAFLPGDSYNGEPANFYITSFKNTDKYKKIYGKAKTPIEGGSQGLIYTINSLDKDNLDAIAKTSLKNILLKKINAQIPTGYILYPDALNFTYQFNDKELFKDSKVKIEILGNMSVLLFKREELSKAIIKNYLPEISLKELNQIKILDLEKFSFNFENKNQIINKETKSINFILNGEVNAIWNPNVEILRTKLTEAPKENISAIFKEDKGVESASIKLFPPWQKKLPSDISRIKIEVKSID